MDQFIMIMILILLIALFGTIATIIIMIKKNDNKVIEDNTPAIKYHDINFDKIKTDFDNMIADEIDLFFKLNPDLIQPGESYITREDIPKIITEITARCTKRLTEPMMDNIKCIYKIDKDDDIINIIGTKVGLVVTGMAVRINNSMLEEPLQLS